MIVVDLRWQFGVIKKLGDGRKANSKVEIKLTIF